MLSPAPITELSTCYQRAVHPAWDPIGLAPWTLAPWTADEPLSQAGFKWVSPRFVPCHVL